MGNPNTHDHSFCWLSTGTLIKSGGVKLALWIQTSFINELMRSRKRFPHVSKMWTGIYNREISVAI